MFKLYFYDKNSFSKTRRLEWSSNWVELELECSILDLNRIEHTLLARANRTSWSFCSSELFEHELLFDELNRTDILVRRACNSNFDLYKNLELNSQIVSWTINFVRRAELSKQFCSTSWLEYQVLFELELWTSFNVLILRLSFELYSSSRVELKKSVWIQFDDYINDDKTYN